jgi:hypothetical protein
MTKPKKRKRGRPKKIRFEDKYEIIDSQISKRRGKWFLKAISWISWEDVEQIIRTHVYNKWHLWDQKRPLEPWLNRIISNQIKNILRNHYGNFIRPCAQCPFNSSGSIDNVHETTNHCSWTKSGKQDGSCPLFAKWEKTKKSSFQINMASSIDENDNISIGIQGHFDIDRSKNKLNELMKENMSEKQYYIYEMLYINDLDISVAAEKLGYKSNEKGRKAGYKQIKNFEKLFKDMAKKLISENDII